jgi:hypothetical protein
MALALLGGQLALAPWLAGSLSERVGALALLIGAAAAVYFAIVVGLGAYTLADFKRHAFRR